MMKLTKNNVSKICEMSIDDIATALSRCTDKDVVRQAICAMTDKVAQEVAEGTYSSDDFLILYNLSVHLDNLYIRDNNNELKENAHDDDHMTDAPVIILIERIYKSFSILKKSNFKDEDAKFELSVLVVKLTLYTIIMKLKITLNSLINNI